MSDHTNTWAFGCSHIYGTGIVEPQGGQPHPEVWPALLARGQFHNLARVGASNQHIVQQLARVAHSIGPGDAVYLQWSTPSRYQFIHQGHDYSVMTTVSEHEPTPDQTRWFHTGIKVAPQREHHEAGDWDRLLSDTKKRLISVLVLQDDSQHHINHLHHIITAQRILDRVGADWWMAFSQPWRCDPNGTPPDIRNTIEALEGCVDWTRCYQSHTFYDDLVGEGFDRGADGDHLGTAAHREFAQRMRGFIKQGTG